MSAPGTPQSTTAPQPPAAPMLGGKLGTAAWIGGPPNEAFDGPALLGPPTPLCFRNLETKAEITGYVKRTEGLATKFKRDRKSVV